ncbi:TetR/AcrR family transcriptional regulator [Lacimicrobium sp. SS2-24]|uniref:TetR/AcrR family transcriptional regulator n=1 Tax=Lacimicrobium sp. SS2-24 TaxID=2005569 RepID=UPI000B4B7898|nr:TetR/AcrR family transcriptional regulator [Lacimicrobium sp. SS2-24]
MNTVKQDASVILDKALELGSEEGWEALRLSRVADALGISLVTVYQHYRQKDDLVEAWFDRADRAMLETRLVLVPASLAPQQRLEKALWCWLQTLSKYHNLTGQMLLYKLEPGHIHLQIGGVLRISRTVQWLMEVADLNATNLVRIRQEIALSALFVSTFIEWLNDSSAQQQRTRKRLQQKLRVTTLLKLWQ